MNSKCTIVVSSCDAYEDTWAPFFEMVKIQWPDRPYPIVLNTESKYFVHEDFEVKTFNLYKPGDKVAWGKRLRETLKRIDTEYIIFLLDDFFPVKKVEQNRIEECIKWMDENPNISVFNFYRVKGGIKDGRFPHFEKRPQSGAYKLNCSAALWRREKLIKYIRPHENPWQFELYGSKRASRYKEDFYSAIEGDSYIYTYDMLNAGIIRGKWAHNTVDFFKQYGVSCDFSKRGFVDEKDPYDYANSTYSLKKNFPHKLFTKRFWQECIKRVKEFVAKIKSLV